jgi:4-hydroxy-2-oxoheptanedioate aldolase
MEKINFDYFASLKGEFEAEGLTQKDVSAEALFAAKHGKDYLVKIGGCEAKGDMSFLMDIGVLSLVAPMVETEFAMSKYMDMLPAGYFEHIGVTIETITAVNNIGAILKAGTKLTDVTIGRTDLTASYGGESVESKTTLDMVKQVAAAAKARGLKVTMGGSISTKTRQSILDDTELRNSLDFVETRKAIISIEKFVEEEAISHALNLEIQLLDRRAAEGNRVLPVLIKRGTDIAARAK